MYKFRWLSKRLPGAEKRRLVLLCGPRQAGKTTLARRLYPDLTYLNLDAPENRDSVRGISSFHWSSTVGNAVIDEAQKEPTVFDKLKYAYDNQEISFSVLSGSSQLLMNRNIRESLAGRAFVYELWPLMLGEITGYADDRLTASPAPPLLAQLLNTASSVTDVMHKVPNRLLGYEEAELEAAHTYMLRWGGMPGLLQLSDEERHEWLKSYQYTYLEHDLSDLAQLPDLEPFKRFEKLCALRSASLLSYSEIARDTGISVETARRYLEYLNVSCQIFLLQPYTCNLTSTVVKSPKIYWSDIGLFRQLTGFYGEATGQLFETYVVTEILKWLRTIGADTQAYFYRTRSGMEIDMLLECGEGEVLGLEIRNRAQVVKNDFRNLRRLAEKFGAKWRGGVCVYQGKAVEKFDEPNFWAIPASRLLGS